MNDEKILALSLACVMAVGLLPAAAATATAAAPTRAPAAKAAL